MGKKKIMIVDDDREFLEELTEILNLSGYEIIAFNNPVFVAHEALAQKPDLILLDLKMPGKSGFELAYELNALCEQSPIPIIAMSGCFKNNDNTFLNICGVKDYLEKPFSPYVLLKKIEELLKEERGG